MSLYGFGCCSIQADAAEQENKAATGSADVICFGWLQYVAIVIVDNCRPSVAVAVAGGGGNGFLLPLRGFGR